eukprot:gene18734-25265_t
MLMPLPAALKDFPMLPRPPHTETDLLSVQVSSGGVSQGTVNLSTPGGESPTMVNPENRASTITDAPAASPARLEMPTQAMAPASQGLQRIPEVASEVSLVSLAEGASQGLQKIPEVASEVSLVSLDQGELSSSGTHASTGAGIDHQMVENSYQAKFLAEFLKVPEGQSTEQHLAQPRAVFFHRTGTRRQASDFADVEAPNIRKPATPLFIRKLHSTRKSILRSTNFSRTKSDLPLLPALVNQAPTPTPTPTPTVHRRGAAAGDTLYTPTVAAKGSPLSGGATPQSVSFPPSAISGHFFPSSCFPFPVLMAEVEPSEGKEVLEADEESNEKPCGLAGWTKRVEELGLLKAIPQSSQATLPVRDLGISLGYLKQFNDSLTPALQKGDVAALVAKLICPLTARAPIRKKGRFFDLIPASRTGRPSYCIIYSSQSTLPSIVDSLVAHVQADDEANIEEVYVWLDWVAMNPHTPLSAAHDLLVDLRDLVATCRYGAIAVMDSKQQMLMRTWPLFEMWGFLYYGPFPIQMLKIMLRAIAVMDSKQQMLMRTWPLFEMWGFLYYGGVKKLKIMLPKDCSPDTVVKIVNACEPLDLRKSISRRPQDTSRILSEVKGSSGMKLFHKLFRDALQLNVRSSLRWSKDVANLALLSESLLLLGEYGMLLIVLYSIPELNDDDQALQEIREIYAAFDTDDGSGELDEDEFVEVLLMAGFGEEEAKKAFNEEFETWWMATHRQEQKTKPTDQSMKPSALVTLVEKLETFLKRRDLSDAADRIGVLISRYKDQPVLMLKGAGSELLPPPLRYDWKSVVDTVAWKLNVGDLRSAAKLLHALLIWNADLVTEDLVTVTPPDEIEDPYLLLHSLSKHLLLTVELLRTQHAKEQYQSLFNNFVKELENSQNVSLLVANMAVLQKKAMSQDARSLRVATEYLGGLDAKAFLAEMGAKEKAEDSKATKIWEKHAGTRDDSAKVDASNSNLRFVESFCPEKERVSPETHEDGASSNGNSPEKELHSQLGHTIDVLASPRAKSPQALASGKGGRPASGNGGGHWNSATGFKHLKKPRA